MKKGSYALKSSHLPILTALFCMIGAALVVPFPVFGEEINTSYDKTTIRYPSMFVGQIWTKSGESPTSARNDGNGQVSAGERKTASSDLKNPPATKPADKETANGKKTADRLSSPAAAEVDPAVKKDPVLDPDVKKKLKQKRLTAVQTLKERNEQQTASKRSSPAAGKERNKTSGDNALQIKKTASSRSISLTSQKTSFAGKNWHHKQQLFDVECSQRLARVVVTYYFDKNEALIGTTLTPEADWYHIYPGSLEERLYVELCHPSLY